MGLFRRFTSLYRYSPPPDEREREIPADQEEELEPLPRLSWSEFWPPSPRVRILYIGLVFFLIQGLLLCVWVAVMVQNNQR